ncbi:MAG: hypothetical protein JO309_06955 [Pseudonocardiales bacterium]|nr:hypothetical protein [Pseudonocardiales bacterium]
MSVSQQLAAALVDLDAEDITVVNIDAQDYGLKVAGPNPCQCACGNGPNPCQCFCCAN